MSKVADFPRSPCGVGFALVALVALSCGTKRDEAPVPAAAGPVEATLIIQPSAGNMRTAILQLMPNVKLTDVTVTFTVPEGCTVSAGATLRQMAELPAGKPFEVPIVFECVEPKTTMVQADLLATAEGGGPVTRKLSTSI